MTTASNSINTDSIERITSGILTIGGVATSVNLKDTTTQTLTVTGRTTSGIETTTITPSYPTTTGNPIVSAGQKGFTLFNTPSLSSNSPIDRTGIIFTVFQSGSAGPFMNIVLPIGVWSISYQFRYRSQSNTTPITRMMMTAKLGTPVTIDEVVYPTNLALTAMSGSIQNTNVSNITCYSGSTIITNNVVNNVVTLQGALIYPTLGNNSPMEVFGGTSTINTFLLAVRIA